VIVAHLGRALDEDTLAKHMYTKCVLIIEYYFLRGTPFCDDADEVGLLLEFPATRQSERIFKIMFVKLSVTFNIPGSFSALATAGTWSL